MTLDLIIAGRRIRLSSAEGVTLMPDERFAAFTVSSHEAGDRPTTGAAAGEGLPPAEGVYDAAGERLPPAEGVYDAAGEGRPPAEGVYDAAGEGLPDAQGVHGAAGASDYRVTAAGRGQPDLSVYVEPGPCEIPSSAEKVFSARLMEEVPGGVVDTGEPFWEVLRAGGTTWARVFLREPERITVLAMPDGERRWIIYAGAPASTEPSVSDGKQESKIIIDPLPYPLDGLLLYYLFSLDGDIMIHGSGVVCGGRGWLFNGRSGSGKTTMARIFDRAGDRVIHDDRLVLRREKGGWVMHNTPVYRDDEPRSAALDHIWLIRHGRANVSEPIGGAEAVAALISNTIQQNWDRAAASRLAAAADELVAAVRVSRLAFLPYAGIRDYLLLRKDEGRSLGADTAAGLLAGGESVVITAGGYSMWPAIRPGDRVMITPAGDRIPAAGEIVALRRDGGFVIHRVLQVSSHGGSTIIITKGDASVRRDEPAAPEAVAGTVESVIRGERQMSPPRRRLPVWLNRTGARIAFSIAGLRKRI